MKTGIYKRKEYCLSFGVDDVIFLDLEVRITRTPGQTVDSYSLDILNHQLSNTKMEFACYLIKMLPSEALAKMNEELRLALVAELTPSLHSLFYVSDIQNDDQSQIKQAS